MVRFGLSVAFGYALLVHLVFSPWLNADDTAAQRKEKPITTAPGKVGELLRQWWKEGTAAGNSGDFFDNRDAGHSDLNMEPYPQLQKIIYTADDIKAHRHWAAQRVLVPHVVFGNSSTSAPPTAGGSNPRMYYVQPAGLAFLYKQYTANNLYVYPEHRDHDPGHNGPGEGFGDLYPTNTPYLIISQGSSGSDQPFMRALPLALAAFRPEVKKKLVETGLLMPMLQMLFRSTNKHLKEPAEYLTAKAHPTVFEGSWVSDLGLVQAAHAVEQGNIPPMIQLRVLEEDEPVAGKDFFDQAGSERLADTPAVIARIVRGKNYRRRLVVSAEGSWDVNKKSLAFTWVLLRGDKDRIKISPTNKNKSVAEIIVPYHARRPIAPEASLESNRVDIGVFAHNGSYYSAPGFVTLFSLDSEARTYDAQGRIVEIGYGMGTTRVSVANWPAFFEAIVTGAAGPRNLPLSKESRELFSAAAPKFKEIHAALKKAQAAFDQVMGEKKEGAAKKSELQKKVAAADKEVQEFLNQPGSQGSLREAADNLLRRAVEDPELVSRFCRDNHKAPELFQAILKPLARMGLLKSGQLGPPGFQFLEPGGTAYEKMLLQRASASLLMQRLLPGMLAANLATNFVDQRLATPKTWRDVYRYDPQGTSLGWTRYTEEATFEFNAEGLLIVVKDELGRCLKARMMRYVQDPTKGLGLNENPLRMVALDTLVTYAYVGKQDRVGKIAAREEVPNQK